MNDDELVAKLEKHVYDHQVRGNCPPDCLISPDDICRLLEMVKELQENLVQHVDSKGNSLCKQAFDNLQAAHYGKIIEDLQRENEELREALHAALGSHYKL